MKVAALCSSLRAFLLVVITGLAMGCAWTAPPVCEDGVLETDLVIKDDEVFQAAGLDSQLRVGPLGEAGVDRCREILGSVTFLGGVSSFEDFDALEYVGGDLAFMERGYPIKEIDGRVREVIEGFGSLLRVEGNLLGRLILGMNALESVGRDVTAPSAGFFSLREVGGSLRGSGALDSLAHLANLEVVGGSFGTSAGDIDSLVSLRYVGGNMEVEFADEVRFSPPLLEEIGANLNVERNEEILTVSVPSLQRIGGRLTFYGNPSNTPDVSDTVRNAFAQVVIPDGVIICSNGPDDFCPWDERCWEVFDSDYCCPVNMGSEECISSRPWGE